jgi:hypothetical protein
MVAALCNTRTAFAVFFQYGGSSMPYTQHLRYFSNMVAALYHTHSICGIFPIWWQLYAIHTAVAVFFQLYAIHTAVAVFFQYDVNFCDHKYFVSPWIQEIFQ